MPSAAITSDATRAMTQTSDASASMREQPHALVAPAAHLAEVDVQHLALAAGPARPLRPQRPERRRHLHADERMRLVRRLPAGEQQLPGQVDVLGRHPRVVAADGEHRSRRNSPRTPATTPTRPVSDWVRRIRPMIDAASRTCIAEQAAAVGDVRRPGDGGDQWRAGHARDEQLERLRDAGGCRRR